ncbi:Y-family DNA polymerase [Paucibacter sp. Y2R2-4]|uniref:Y-family DNA polymerase n=1 Tax=Paucibacter sp. Y2R2-4 TaxID=2893553 RepID=UPI0021E383F7|nr:DNA polymerase Y family protein [Paucibacter sp. Y2R2-4]MCV2349416.1 DNA polymerase Y family protein [Paucibacter sp. Y2R2-4]
MHWLALLCPPAAPDEAQGWSAAPEQVQQALAWWALQFTPKVALLEDAVVLEVAACLRLFGGAATLHRRIQREAAESGLRLAAMAWAPNSLAALALARAGQRDGLSQALAPLLDGLPLHSLSAVQAQAPMLARLGCRTLGDVRRLPRAGLSRRFGPAAQQALDQAHGQRAEAHVWLQAPAQFEARLELPFRVEHAPLLLHYAQHLLRQLCAWLAARHAGIQQLSLHWEHDAMRARSAGRGGSLSLHTACTTRDFGHLSRLLGEHLALQTLDAPAGEIRLQAGEVLPLQESTASLLPAAPEQAHEPLPQLLERLSVRLGADRVRCGRLQEDHRLEAMQHWLPWTQASANATAPAVRAASYPQPTWLLEPPLRLAVRQDQPQYQQAALQLLAGPQRIEGGWWQTLDEPSTRTTKATQGQPETAQMQRDYFLALSAGHIVLWVFQQRLSDAEHGWFLHGVFA